MNISGRTRLFATIGDPVAQIRMPELMAHVFKELQLDAIWLPFEIAAADLDACTDMLRSVRNLGGFSVTVPHKAAMLARVDKPTRRAEIAGGVNLVRRDVSGAMIGDMVDGIGFVAGLQAAGHQIAGRSAWVCGTGGAGSAIAAALCERGIARLFLYDLDDGKAEALARRLRPAFPQSSIEAGSRWPPSVDFAINATPCGLKTGDPLPFDPLRFDLSTVVCDVIMKPPVTALLDRAREGGRRIQPGKAMLDHQIPLYLSFFGMPHSDAAVMRIVEDEAPPHRHVA